MDKWDILHTYRRFAEQGLVQPLTCSVCDARVHTRLSSDDDPMLCCLAGHNTFPGTNWYDEVEKMIRSIRK